MSEKRAHGGDCVWINGKIHAADAACVSVFDIGFLRGVGAFDSMRTYNGHPHALSAHCERLWHCAEELGIEKLYSNEEVAEQIQACLDWSGYAEARINIIVTPGINTDGLFATEKPTWIIIVRKLHVPSQSTYDNGITAVFYRGGRQLAHLKTTNYLSAQKGSLLAKKNKAYEALYVDEHDIVSEGLTSNLVIIEGNTAIEPQDNCLPGITKSNLKIVAEQNGLTWTSDTLNTKRVLAADEVWICSSIRELVAVVQIDNQKIGSGKPGPWAQKLIPLFHQHNAKLASSQVG